MFLITLVKTILPMSPSAEFWDAENECFGEGKTRRLEVSEVSAEKRALMSGAIERMTAKSREDYLYHLLLMAERAGGNASKSLKSRRLARLDMCLDSRYCVTAFASRKMVGMGVLFI